MPAIDKPIRVIKRESRDFTTEEDGTERAQFKTDVQARRQICQTITSWVEEQREAKKAFCRRRLFVAIEKS